VTTGPSGHGSLGEEAARLAEAVQQWLHGLPDRGRTAGAAQEGRQAAGEHEAGSVLPECLLCPTCQLLRMVRTARPEVYAHVADAAASLSAALRELMADGARQAQRRGNVEHIDLG
jgi:hypothetical protein